MRFCRNNRHFAFSYHPFKLVYSLLCIELQYIIHTIFLLHSCCNKFTFRGVANKYRDEKFNNDEAFTTLNLCRMLKKKETFKS